MEEFKSVYLPLGEHFLNKTVDFIEKLKEFH